MDVVVRAFVAFVFVFLLTRLIGRRELSSLQPFDLILLIVIGDLMQQGVTQNDLSVTGANITLKGERQPCNPSLPRVDLNSTQPQPRRCEAMSEVTASMPALRATR